MGRLVGAARSNVKAVPLVITIWAFTTDGPRTCPTEAKSYAEKSAPIINTGQKRARPGRPAKDDPAPARRTVYKVAPELRERRDDRIEADVAREALFILITNDTQRDAQSLLGAYRGQQGVENEFRWLKAPMYVSPVFLKKTERATAFGYVALIAYLVYALIQHAVRAAMDAGEQLQVEGRRTDRPTGTAVLDMLRHIRVVHLHLKNGMRRRILQTVKPAEARILSLLDIDADLFVAVRPLPP